MNYAAHYERLIARARTRTLTCYLERHHVIPRCMGGGNEKSNLADLTPEEHYIAHQILVKIHPGHLGLALAAARGFGGSPNNKSFGWLRRRLADALRGNRFNDGRIISAETRAKLSAAGMVRKQSPEAIAKTAAAARGRRHTEEAKEKMAAAAKGNTRTLGMVHSPETRAKIAAAHIGKPLSLEHRAKLSAAWTPVSEEARKKISAALKGRKKSLEHRAKLSAAKLGKPGHSGWNHSMETRAKMSATKQAKRLARINCMIQ